MGVSGAGMTTALETYRPVFMVVTFGLLGSAFYLTYRPRRPVANEAQDCCASSPSKHFNMMTLNKAMLWVVTVMAVVFLFFPQYLTNLFTSPHEITTDMHRTVITVAGMTCPG
jgi:hypothetical protein